MKTFKAICAATVLALSLSLPTYADTNPGDGHGPGRATGDASDLGTVTTSDDSAFGASADGTDGGLVSLADILWALASIY